MLVLAVLIVTAVVVVVRRPHVEPVESILGDDDRNVVRLGVEDCIKQAGEAAIRIVALQGGYDVPPKPVADAVYVSTPYYVVNGSVRIPKIADVEESLSRQVNRFLPVCLNGEVKGRLGKISLQEVGPPVTESIISKSGVAFKIKYPLAIKKESVVLVLDEFSWVSPLPLYPAMMAAGRISEMQVNAKDMIPLSDILERIDEENGYFFPISLSDSTYIFSFSVSKNDFELPFAFAVEIPAVMEEEGVLIDG